MAFLDFGFGRGAAHKVDFNARYNRERQTYQDQLSEKRYKDEQQHREEREKLNDDLKQEQINWDRNWQIKQDARDQAETYVPPQYATLYQAKRAEYSDPLLTEIGDLETSPDLHTSPEKIKRLNELQRKVISMPGEEGYRSAVDDYDQMVKDHDSGKIDDDEFEKEVAEWEKYNNQTGEITEHYSYIPKPEFVVTNQINSYLEGNQATVTYDDDGRGYYSFDPATLSTMSKNFYNTNQKDVDTQFAGLGAPGMKEYNNDPEAWIRSLMKANLGVGKQTKPNKVPAVKDPYFTKNTTDPNSPFMKNIVHNKGGHDPGIRNFIPVTIDGNIRKLQNAQKVRFGADVDGTMNTTGSLNLPEGMNVFITNHGYTNMGEWQTFKDGHKYAKVQMYIKASDVKSQTELKENPTYLLLPNTWYNDEDINAVKDEMSKNGIPYKEQKSGLTDADTKEVATSIVVFEGWIPMQLSDSKKQAEYNKSSIEYDPINPTGSTGNANDPGNLFPQ